MSYLTAMTLSLTILVSLESTLPAAAMNRLCPTFRPSDAWIASLIAEGRRRSPTFRRLADRLEALKVILYIESRSNLPHSVGGATHLMGSGGGYRYVRVSIRGRCARDLGTAILGHELQHGLEIAEASDVVDAESMAAFYRRTGVRGCSGATIECYDTARAREVGDAVLTELQTP